MRGEGGLRYRGRFCFFRFICKDSVCYISSCHDFNHILSGKWLSCDYHVTII